MEDRESGTEVDSGRVWIGDNWTGCKCFIYLHFMFESKLRKVYVGLFIWSQFLSPERSNSKSTQNHLQKIFIPIQQVKGDKMCVF